MATLNATDDETLLQSYLKLGTSVGCNDESVEMIATSIDLREAISSEKTDKSKTTEIFVVAYNCS